MYFIEWVLNELIKLLWSDKSVKALTDCVPCILYPIISPYFLFGRFVIEIWGATSVREMSDYLWTDRNIVSNENST